MRGWGHGKTKQVCEGTAGTGRTDDAERQERYDPQRAAICSIAERIGCSAETLRNRGRRTEREARRRPGRTEQQRAPKQVPATARDGLPALAPEPTD